MATDTIIDRLQAAAGQVPDQAALVYKKNGNWITINWKGYSDLVQRVGRALMSIGYQPGQVLSILSNNRVEWVVSDLAVMAVGGVATGIYQTCTPEQVSYIVSHSECPAVIVENLEQLAKFKQRKRDLKRLAERGDSLRQKAGSGTALTEGEQEELEAIQKSSTELSQLKWAVLLDGAAPAEDGQWVMSWDDLLARADATPVAAYQARLAALQPDDLATLIYTSGTTGNPKGVMLSHRNLIWTSDSLKETLPVEMAHSGISYLPLSHIAEQVLSLHLAITMRSTIWFAESLEKLKENLPDVRPTVFFGVPRVWEKFEAALAVGLNEATGAKAALVRFARNTAVEVNKAREQGKEPAGLLGLKYAIASKLVLSKLKNRLGLDRTVLFSSGAAPISRSTLEFFRSLDIVIKEVYGQSEGTGPTTINRYAQYRLGTVGPAIPGCDVKIAADGEILVKGGNVFLGYFKDAQATGETLIDGWLHSGDVGEFDADGFLRITDRKKDLIITAGGKNVAPQNIEKLLKSITEVSQAVVIGERRKYLAALLTIETEAARRWASAHQVSWSGLEALVADSKFREYMQGEINKVNSQLANYETIKKFELLPIDFTSESGELTPTMKVKRKVVNQRYKEVIESMYA